MSEPILPGTYIEVRPEALIVGGPITVGNIGIVGTARLGPVGVVQLLSSYGDALQTFGSYDPFGAPDTAAAPFTLTRALEVAYRHGASTVLAVRVTSAAATTASLALGTVATVSAANPGAWGSKITVTVVDAGPAGSTVTLALGPIEEVYTAKDGNDLAKQVNNKSAVAVAKPGTTPSAKLPAQSTTALGSAVDGANAGLTEYAAGLDMLLEADAHIILLAGLEDTGVAAALKAHVDAASTDKIKRDRIAVLGTNAAPKPLNKSTFISNLSITDSDRLVLVTPGIEVTDAAQAAANARDPTHAVDPSVNLPGTYAAAAVAGLLSANDPHVSLTNKGLSVEGLELNFNSAELEQLVTKGVLALENRRGIRVVKGITTNQGAFRQITTRRIVDYAKFGVRAAADPFIGLLNNDRVRKALKGSINGFLAEMVDDEMLESYELDVTASRDEEIRGIAKVTMTIRPTFSIDYIKVVMFLG